MIEDYIKKRLEQKQLLLMTHIVLGYPDFETSFRLIETMVKAGVDLMELQIPFSEPIADGPVILKANQQALMNGATVAKCFDVARKAASSFDIPFLFMTYYNIAFRYGIERFGRDMAAAGLKGAIIPDLPPEEGADYLKKMEENGLSPIFIFSPTTPPERLQYIAGVAKGFIYCVARKGVTGQSTSFSQSLEVYLAQCREATSLPLALGFGVKDRTDMQFLKGKVDIAVIGTETLSQMELGGVASVGPFIQELLRD
jgi:tryptophan synthase alpha chain